MRSNTKPEQSQLRAPRWPVSSLCSVNLGLASAWNMHSTFRRQTAAVIHSSREERCTEGGVGRERTGAQSRACSSAEGFRDRKDVCVPLQTIEYRILFCWIHLSAIKYLFINTNILKSFQCRRRIKGIVQQTFKLVPFLQSSQDHRTQQLWSHSPARMPEVCLQGLYVYNAVNMSLEFLSPGLHHVFTKLFFSYHLSWLRCVKPILNITVYAGINVLCSYMTNVFYSSFHEEFK